MTDELPEPFAALPITGSQTTSVYVWTSDQMHAFRADGVAAERERCARAIEQYGGAWDVTTQNFARLIRARAG